MKLYGKNSISERIRARPASIQRLFFNGSLAQDPLVAEAKKHRVACEPISAAALEKMGGHHYVQGLVAEVEEFSYAGLEDLICLPDAEKYVFLALSNVTDPQNMGSILRTAACFGRFALLIPKHRTVTVNETVLKVASGGENYVPVVQETNLIPALQRLKQAGYWVAGSVVEEGQDLTKFSFPFPLCLVIGAEDKGIRHGLLAHLDFKITLPMPGFGLSFNAAVATAIFSYEIARQRSGKR
jgi:23S rRNA (guanosine2251-2'-O)-methyltransferase